MATLLDGQYEVFWNVAGASLELALRVRTTGCAVLRRRPEVRGGFADQPREHPVEYVCLGTQWYPLRLGAARRDATRLLMVSLCVCVCACVRACVRACVCVCKCVNMFIL